MRHDAFIGQVQDRAQLASRGEAEGATRATLETLGERIPEQLADNLADQLPREIGENLRRTEVEGGSGTGERFDREEFIHRVSVRSGFPEQQADKASRVVFEVLEEATQGSMMDKVRETLTDDLRELINTPRKPSQ
ncbi:DUF2267 domain-containing protein [Saccharopolyspora rectivirgula]|jgi:uncharacterized protein (DUF2267 family)|uniref:DUF2267 domain-containing protein n=1 Tax=Saccharopolyspora rectivirgula TaxID=28042 RepID=A0A073B092_9PSEU|nr:DUF2267 domain-containing protein [Saccharopolyspora rectivirgula]KEI44991.1 hypothetical protein GU90_07230 [Saccharopolyspora rectivirgula]